MHTGCSEVLVKDIKRCKVSGGRSESLPVRHRVLVDPSVLADDDRTLPGSPVAFFLVLTRFGVWTVCTRAYLSTRSRTLQALAEACVKLGTARRLESASAGPPYGNRYLRA